MFWLYVNSLIVGMGLGVVQAIVFYRETKRALNLQVGPKLSFANKTGSFIIRYIGLLVFLWILFFKYRFDIYSGMVGFFVAFWGMLLKKVKELHES
jgi:hypothetical protein